MPRPVNHVEPISPEDIPEARAAVIPPEVIEAFNYMIALKFSGGRAVIRQDDVLERICSTLNVSRETVFNKHYLDVEDIYRDKGWSVTYEKPGYNETYPATFTFATKKD